MLGLAILAVVALGIDIDQVLFELPFDDKTKGPDGYPIYMDDAVAATTFPWIANAGPRLDQCLSGMTIPEVLTIQYQPRIVSPHIVSTNILQCEHQRNSSTQLCSVGESQPAYFDVDASQYFTAVEEIPLSEIVGIAHAIVHGDVSFANSIQDPKLNSKRGFIGTIEKNGDGYLIHYGDCGCSGLMKLRRDSPEN